MNLLGGKKGLRFVLDGWAAGEKERPTRKKSIDADFKELAKQFGTAADFLRESDRRWNISAKRAKVVAALVRDRVIE